MNLARRYVRVDFGIGANDEQFGGLYLTGEVPVYFDWKIITEFA